MANRNGTSDALQDDLDPVIKAALANVVRRLRRDWIAHMAGHWRDIHPINENAVGELEKRIALALREGFGSFSQLLCGFEVLLLQGHDLGLEFENVLLGIEKLLVQLSDCQRDLVEISKAHKRLTQILGDADRTGGSTDS